MEPVQYGRKIFKGSSTGLNICHAPDTLRFVLSERDYMKRPIELGEPDAALGRKRLLKQTREHIKRFRR